VTTGGPRVAFFAGMNVGRFAVCAGIVSRAAFRGTEHSRGLYFQAGVREGGRTGQIATPGPALLVVQKRRTLSVVAGFVAPVCSQPKGLHQVSSVADLRYGTVDPVLYVPYQTCVETR